MNRRGALSGALAALVLAAAGLRAQAPASPAVPPPADASRLLRDDEKHLRNLRQLTFGGENAEAYWSPDGTRARLPVAPATGDALRPDLRDRRRRRRAPAPGVDGQGAHHLRLLPARATSASSTPRPTSRRRTARPRPTARRATSGRSTRPTTSSAPRPTAPTCGASPTRPATTPRPRSRPTANHRLHLDARRRPRALHHGRRRHGRPAPHQRAGLRRRRRSSRPTARTIVYRRASRAGRGGPARDYRELLGARPRARRARSRSGSWTADGRDKRQVTHLGAANFAPFFHPDGKRIIFSLEPSATPRAATSTSTSIGDRRHRPRAR